MTDWIHLFEKYRIDRRLSEIYRSQLEVTDPNSPRYAQLNHSYCRTIHDVHAAERVLSCYGDGVDSPREALRHADERLFLAHRYILGMTMEATAEAMGVSRDTVYRIRRRIVARGAVPPEILSTFSTLPIGEAAPSAEVALPFPVNTLSSTDTPPSPAADPHRALAGCFAGAPGGLPPHLR